MATSKNICGSTDTESGEPCQRPQGWGAYRDVDHCKDHELEERCANCGLELVEGPKTPSVRCRYYSSEGGVYLCEACFFRAPDGSYDNDGMTLRERGRVEHIEELRRDSGYF